MAFSYAHYERGVEDETLSCGTGVTAAALMSAHNDNGFNRVEVRTPGGRLSVEYNKIDDQHSRISGYAVRLILFLKRNRYPGMTKEEILIEADKIFGSFTATCSGIDEEIFFERPGQKCRG